MLVLQAREPRLDEFGLLRLHRITLLFWDLKVLKQFSFRAPLQVNVEIVTLVNSGCERGQGDLKQLLGLEGCIEVLQASLVQYFLDLFDR